MPPLTIGLIFGGQSFEHEISLASAINVRRALLDSGKKVVEIGIDKLGNWYHGENMDRKIN